MTNRLRTRLFDPHLVAAWGATVAAAFVAAFAVALPARSDTVLFIGNSFTYADKSPVHYFRHETVTDLNGDGVGGVPALFKSFTLAAGLDDTVSLETSGGKGLDWHLRNKATVIGKPWDVVVMHDYSTLNAPPNPATRR